METVPPATSTLPWLVVVPDPSLRRRPLGRLTVMTFPLQLNAVACAPAPIVKSRLICRLGRSGCASPESATQIDPPWRAASRLRIRSALGPAPLFVTVNEPG